ncbi:DNA-binding GntR family transcriptional regulator [Aequitasia blattaphilus]|uniref:GntR family transcriptional regulator n=1 Tax=Aequitasia blattaphilus TaxID=2949332 RepID=A0ABT1E528_9FIRM|nr:GntR family transcriptional regulator [Aequitasia blattaphilus]MCP1100948.1 GntR family transcriptional regulator [Aequitasia blattaphilus]MCR8613588.1 GntR family transcriptional regulator [Aequitasia blattaphilus]
MKKASLSDLAYESIKDNILKLVYPPGSALTETGLANELGMSRNPIRTAVKQLEIEGLLLTDYHKSIIVKPITQKDIDEIYQLREILESKAFRMIFDENRMTEFSYRIEEKVVRMFANAEDIYDWEIADIEMHMEIISVFENSRINRIYENNLYELVRMGQYSVKHGMAIHQTNENLRRMVELMRSNDFEGAYSILEKDHFVTGKETATL